MNEFFLSLGEKTFIRDGVEFNLRNDGRSRYQYRSMELETGLIEHAHGSARVCIGNITDILVNVKLEIDTPHADKPLDGKLDFSVDSFAAPTLEGKAWDNMLNEITHVLSLAYKSTQVFNLKQLCIIPGKKCWKIYVDILILQSGGNLFDAIGLAVKAALYNTKIPKVIVAMLDGDEEDIQVSDDVHDCSKLDTKNYPIIIMLCKIGDNFVVDPTLKEELCSVVSLILSIQPNSKLTTIIKQGSGTIMPHNLIDTLRLGQNIGLKLNEIFMETLEKERQLGPSKTICGFRRK